jgi:putative addiction module CopG family antidote
MATSTLNISLPESQRLFVEAKIKNEGYGTISEYVRELIRQEQRKEELKEMQREIFRQEIQKGIDDIREGRSITLQTPEDYEKLAEQIISEGRAKVAQKQNDK